MKKLLKILWMAITLCACNLGHAESDKLLEEVENYLRVSLASDEGFYNPAHYKRHDRVIADKRDWESALLHIVDSGSYDESMILGAIAVLQLRGTLNRPENVAILNRFLTRKVSKARAQIRDRKELAPVVRSEIRSLASRFSKFGGPDLLLAVINVAASPEEQNIPILGEDSMATIAAAVEQKGDQRHVQGTKLLMANTKDKNTREKLNRALGKIGSRESSSPSQK